MLPTPPDTCYKYYISPIAGYKTANSEIIISNGPQKAFIVYDKATFIVGENSLAKTTEPVSYEYRFDPFANLGYYNPNMLDVCASPNNPDLKTLVPVNKDTDYKIQFYLIPDDLQIPNQPAASDSYEDILALLPSMNNWISDNIDQIDDKILFYDSDWLRGSPYCKYSTFGGVYPFLDPGSMADTQRITVNPTTENNKEYFQSQKRCLL